MTDWHLRTQNAAALARCDRDELELARLRDVWRKGEPEAPTLEPLQLTPHARARIISQLTVAPWSEWEQQLLDEHSVIQRVVLGGDVEIELEISRARAREAKRQTRRVA